MCQTVRYFTGHLPNQQNSGFYSVNHLELQTGDSNNGNPCHCSTNYINSILTAEIVLSCKITWASQCIKSMLTWILPKHVCPWEPIWFAVYLYLGAIHLYLETLLLKDKNSFHFDGTDLDFNVAAMWSWCDWAQILLQLENLSYLSSLLMFSSKDSLSLVQNHFTL